MNRSSHPPALSLSDCEKAVHSRVYQVVPSWKRSGDDKREEHIYEETVDPVEYRTGPDALLAGKDKDKEGRHDSDLKHRIETDEFPMDQSEGEPGNYECWPLAAG